MIVKLPNGNSYFMENKLAEKLDLMVKRTEGNNKDDNVILIDGDEGQGKSNMLAGIAGYIHLKTKRPLTNSNIFFDLDKLMKFAIHTEKQIILWDEGALGGLATEWWKKNQVKFLKLLMVARKKRHFWVICIPKFFKLNEYLVVDRSIAMIHCYSRKNVQKGRFTYLSKNKKEQLFYDWKRTRKRRYKKYVSFRGSFPIALPKVFNEEEYERMKDEAILNLDGEEDKDAKTSKIEELKYKISQLPLEDKTKAIHFEVSERTIRRWKKLKDKLEIPLENPLMDKDNGQYSYTRGNVVANTPPIFNDIMEGLKNGKRTSSQVT